MATRPAGPSWVIEYPDEQRHANDEDEHADLVQPAGADDNLPAVRARRHRLRFRSGGVGIASGGGVMGSTGGAGFSVTGRATGTAGTAAIVGVFAAVPSLEHPAAVQQVRAEVSRAPARGRLVAPASKPRWGVDPAAPATTDAGSTALSQASRISTRVRSRL